MDNKETVKNTPPTTVDFETKELRLADGTLIGYDYLVRPTQKTTDIVTKTIQNTIKRSYLPQSIIRTIKRTLEKDILIEVAQSFSEKQIISAIIQTINYELYTTQKTTIATYL